MKHRRSRLLLLLLFVAGLLGWWRYLEWREHRYDVVIREAARRYGVDPALVKAVVWRESRFSAGAKGRAGELGLMQIRAAAAGEWATAERINVFSPAQLRDPSTNTLAGAWYLAKLLKRYRQTNNPIPYALADYNAGRSNVLRWNKGAAETNAAVFLECMDFPRTRKYVNEVTGRRKRNRVEGATKQ